MHCFELEGIFVNKQIVGRTQAQRPRAKVDRKLSNAEL